MPKWTKEQEEAIYKSNSNIIVSAGAGSGKTAVLTRRVIEKLKSGIKINNLIILTFTNAAAREMKERIRKEIMTNEDLLDNLDYLDSAPITTFDSYALEIVKKYSYLLNVSSSLSIVDNNIIILKKKEIIDNIFDNYYMKDNHLFKKFIDDFAIKNDNELKDAILKLISKIDLISEKELFLNNYLDKYLSKEKIKGYISEYLNIIYEVINDIEENLMYLENSDYNDYYLSMVSVLDKLIKSKSYDEIKNNSLISLPRRPRNSEDIIKYKEAIDEDIKKIKNYTRFTNIEEIYESFEISKNYVEIIIEIIKEYYELINKYKKDNDLYEFIDIELLAIKLLKNNAYIRDEIKYNTHEIEVDEYQDTNDLQEEFISLIANNNVYMVGDIKQSIYGFRNANPTIFKNKYDNYSKLKDGIKIDLLKNFRSRKEVLEGINIIFSKIMDDYIGGADYLNTHQMVFGNLNYEENKKIDENYDLEILNYDYLDKKYTKEEIEIFLIANDIKNKINNNYQVLDKNTNKLRNIRYEDFCIIMDRGTSFSLYKKIFNYLNIPLFIYEDKKLTEDVLLYLINNILTLIFKIRDNIFDIEFKYAFISISRSYLISLDDNEIFNIIKNNSYKDTKLYNIILEIIDKLDLLNNYELIELVIDKFNIYENSIKVGNIEDNIIRIDYIKDLARNLSEIGYSTRDFNNYLSNIINNKNEITYKGDNNSLDSVKIMNIHKSKGLEFPVCYFSGLYKEFNTMDIKTRFVFDNTYGIITPYFKEGISSTILKDLLKEKYLIQNIAEQIRLFYVALTRAKEKIILVTSLDEERKYSNKVVSNNVRKKYNSFISFLNSISGNLDKYIKNIDVEKLNITKDYLYDKEINNIEENTNNLRIKFKKINVDNSEIENTSPSKKINKLINREEHNKLEYGTYIHKLFEQTDFLNIEDDNPVKDKINNLVNMLNINSNTIIYKEHEFIYEKDLKEYHGIIDLLLIDNNIVRIVDYKLKDIDDELYIEQLKIYYEYVKDNFDKKVEAYLYSILDNKLKRIEL